MSGGYNGVDEWVRGGGLGGGGGWEAGGRLNPLVGLFGLAMSPRSEMSHYNWGEFQTHAFHGTHLHGSYCLSCEFTWLAKLALEKQISQPKPGNGTVNG